MVRKEQWEIKEIRTPIALYVGTHNGHKFAIALNDAKYPEKGGMVVGILVLGQEIIPIMRHIYII